MKRSVEFNHMELPLGNGYIELNSQNIINSKHRKFYTKVPKLYKHQRNKHQSYTRKSSPERTAYKKNNFLANQSYSQNYESFKNNSESNLEDIEQYLSSKYTNMMINEIDRFIVS